MVCVYTFVQRGVRRGLVCWFYNYSTRGQQDRLRNYLLDPVNHTAEREREIVHVLVLMCVFEAYYHIYVCALMSASYSLGRELVTQTLDL